MPKIQSKRLICADISSPWYTEDSTYRGLQVEAENTRKKEELKKAEDTLNNWEMERKVRRDEMRVVEEKLQDALFKFEEEKRLRRGLEEIVMKNSEWLESTIRELYITEYKQCFDNIEEEETESETEIDTPEKPIEEEGDETEGEEADDAQTVIEANKQIE